MIDKDTNDIALAIIKHLSEGNKISPETHEIHHDYIRTVIAKEERKAELWENVKKQVFGWGIIAMLGAIGIGVSQWFQHVFNNK